MRSRLAAVAPRSSTVASAGSGILTYDDLLTRLDGTLAGADGACGRRAACAQRFRVVLVDEFQDTDPVQWEIVRRAFGGAEEDRALVLIGDPKQAIYAFRGADVHAYLAAAREAGNAGDARHELAQRPGADRRARRDVRRCPRSATTDIVYRRVRAAEAHREPRLHGAPVDLPLRVRVVHRDDPTVAHDEQGLARTEAARQHVADDVAARDRRAAVLGRRARGPRHGRRRPRGGAVEPGDLAVLVRTHTQASIVREALAPAGVPAVISGAGSVFGTPPAREWLRLLEALERPTLGAACPDRGAHVLLRLDRRSRWPTAGDDAWEAVHRRLHGWARVLRTRGVASLLEVDHRERAAARAGARAGRGRAAR